MENKKTINKKLLWCIIGGALALLLIVAGIILSSGNQHSAAMPGCKVQVITEGGMALEDIGVYIYEDESKAELVSFAKTDKNGFAAFTVEVPDGSVVILENVPAGYDVAENYPVTAAEVTINLSAKLLTEMTEITVGGIMFDFTVTDTDGTEHTLSELLKEKSAVVLNLWYTGCQPCKAEFPYLQQAYDAYKNSIALLALNPVDGEDNAAVAAFKAENNLTFPMAKCDGKWTELVKNIAYPTTIIIDRYGMVSLMHTGSIDSAKTFEDAFAFFASEHYTQTTVESISSLITSDENEEDQGGNTTETTSPTVPETTAPTVQPETSAPTTPPATTAPSGSSGSTNSSDKYNGKLANADAPIEQYGLNKFTIDVRAGEKMLVYMIRVSNEGTLTISDSSAYVVMDGTVYKPNKSGNVQVAIKSEGSFTPIELEIGNAGSTDKTYTVKFSFPKGSFENPIEMKKGNNTVNAKAGNDQGTYYTFKATQDGTLTLNVKSISPSNVVVGISISDMQTIPTEAILEEGSDTVSIELKAGVEARIVISTRDPNKEWKIPKAEIVIEAVFQ